MTIDFTHPKKISKELSRWLSVMGFVCTVLVVMIHATPSPVFGSWQWWVTELLGKSGLGRVAVPYFFLVAGFLLAGHFNEDGWYKREVLKRVHSLLVPYAVWTVIFVIVNFALFFCIQAAGYQCGFKNPFYGPWWLWVINVVGLNPFKNIGILWFVRDLFALVVISPIILMIVRKTSFLLPLASFIGLLTIGWMTPLMSKDIYNLFEYFLSIRGLCYFSLGIVMRFVDFKIKVNVVLLIFSGLGLIVRAWLLMNGFVRGGALIDVAMVPCLLSLVWLLRNLQLPQILIDNSFPVFLMHTMMLLFTLVVAVAIGFRRYVDSSILMAIIRVILAVVMSLVISVALKKLFPCGAARIFGGR